MRKILITESDATYGKILQQIMKAEGYEVTIKRNTVDALTSIYEEKIDLIISELMRDSASSLAILKLAKVINTKVAIIILADNPTSQEEMAYLNIGVQHFFTKPIKTQLLLRYVARIAAYQHKKEVAVTQLPIYSFPHSHIIVDTNVHQVFKDDEIVPITEKEYAILYQLISKSPKALSRRELLDAVWELTLEKINSRVIDTHIRSLRHKLQSDDIKTIRGYGYRWEGNRIIELATKNIQQSEK